MRCLDSAHLRRPGFDGRSVQFGGDRGRVAVVRCRASRAARWRWLEADRALRRKLIAGLALALVWR